MSCACIAAVNVNRSDNLVMVDTECLTARTHDALIAVDPFRKGFEASKADPIANADVTAER